MKKLLLILMAAALAFALCSCSLINNITDIINGKTEETPDPSEATPEALSEEQEQLLSAVTGELDLDSLTLDELLKLYDVFLQGENDAVNDGAEYDLLYGDVEIKANDPSAEAGFEMPENAQQATVSDEPWEDKTFEALDITANMSPEDKAQYEAMMQELEDFDANEFQQGIDGMLQGTEGFEDYEPGDYGDPGISNEWPDNEITKNVPKPPFDDAMIVASEDTVTVMRYDSTAEQAKAYVKQLKDAGFTKDVYENTNEAAGIAIYTFTATNANGVSVSLTLASGSLIATFSK